MNKFRSITGTLPRKYEITNWSESKFLAFFSFVSEFLKDDKLSVTKVKIIELEEKYLKGTTPFEEELLHRINQFSKDPDFQPRKFFFKFGAFIRQVGNTLKDHPAMVTADMKEAIMTNPRLIWIATHYKEHEAKMGGTVIIANTLEDTLPEQKTITKTPNPQLTIMESMVTLADVLQTLVSSIKPKELREMKAKEKIDAATKILGTLKSATSFKPNATIFQNITINKAGKDELEKAMAEFAEQ